MNNPPLDSLAMMTITENADPLVSCILQKKISVRYWTYWKLQLWNICFLVYTKPVDSVFRALRLATETLSSIAIHLPALLCFLWLSFPHLSVKEETSAGY